MNAILYEIVNITVSIIVYIMYSLSFSPPLFRLKKRSNVFYNIYYEKCTCISEY